MDVSMGDISNGQSTMVDGTGQSNPVVEGDVTDTGKDMHQAPSFKDKLLGATRKSREPTSITELDVEVRDEDVRLGSETSPMASSDSKIDG
ncbi:hypothetical protein V6N13_048259 [Hibiscus sabdariffa]